MCTDCVKKTKGLRCHSCENKHRHQIGLFNSKGINNPNYRNGKYSSDKTYFCLYCNKKLSTGNAKRCGSCANKLKIKHGKCQKIYYCKDCGSQISDYRKLRCMSCCRKGELNPSYLHRGQKHWAYIDGRSYLPYSKDFTMVLRNKIRKRDNYICQNCNMTEEEHLIIYSQNLHVHHIDYNKMNSSENNLISLCLICNVKANYNRNYWFEYYTQKVGIING